MTKGEIINRLRGYIEEHYPLCERVEKGLDEMAQLSNNWDSYGAYEISKLAIDRAKGLCRYFPPSMQPEIEPLKIGGIGLSWPGIEDIEVTVRGDGFIEIIETVT